MFCCLLKKELTFTLSRLGTNCVSFSQVKFLVFEAQPVFSKLSEAAPLDERGRISITSTPSLHYRTLGDDAPALLTVKKWEAEFKRGRESLEDDPRSERPYTATTQENIDRIYQMVMNERR